MGEIVNLEKETKEESKVITLAEQTVQLMQNIQRDMQALQQTFNVILSTVIAEKGDSTLQYNLAPDGKSLLPVKPQDGGEDEGNTHK